MITAIIRGGMYSLMAVGLSLVFGVMNVANFAHGELYMIGTYLAYFAFVTFGLNPILSILLAAAGGFLLGATVEKVFFSQLRARSGRNWLMNTFLMTLGLSLIMKNGVKLIWGNTFRGITSYYPNVVRVGGLSVAQDRLVAIAIAILVITATMLFLNYTKFGRGIRATSMDPTGASLVGINLKSVYAVTFGLSCGFTAMSGAALLTLTPAFPDNGATALYASWVVLILVGMGNVGGSIVGGVIVGVLETLCIQYLGAAWQNVFTLSIVILLLLIKPNGLFGMKGVKSAVE
jgi:branched-chain amino acid transport system permease protein